MKLPVDYLDIVLRKPLAIKAGDADMRFQLFTIQQFIDFNVRAQALWRNFNNTMRAKDEPQTSYLRCAQRIFAYQALVHYLYTLSCESVPAGRRRAYRRAVYDALLKNVELTVTIYEKIYEYNTLLKKKLTLLGTNMSRLTAGAHSSAGFAAQAEQPPTSFRPRF